MKSLNLNGVREKQLHERIEYYIDSQVITDECVAYPEESVESTLKKSYIISTEQIAQMILVTEQIFSMYFLSRNYEWTTEVKRKSFRTVIEKNNK